MKLAKEFLCEVGLGDLVDTSAGGAVLAAVRDSLELRVGTRLVDGMTVAQLSEFEVLFDPQDDTASFSWLQTNFPDYKEVVLEELACVKAQVIADAPGILAIERALLGCGRYYEAEFAALTKPRAS